MPIRVERGAKRVRTYLAGECVADTDRPLLVWEHPRFPAYWFPPEHVRVDLLRATGDPARHDVVVGDRVAPGAATIERSASVPELEGAVHFDWPAMDAWFEEDEEVIVHPRDPYTRIDVLASSRHVRVSRDGAVLAESHAPTILFETHLPPRFYLPQPHVDMTLLVPSDSSTRCPYKGTARYWSARIGDRLLPDIAWSYPSPLPESQKIAGLVCFYNERVDLDVDGVRWERPVSPFS